MKIKVLLICLLFFISLGSTRSYAQPVECPNAKDLVIVPVEEVNQVIDSLKVLVPTLYEVGEFPEYYSKWELVTIKPFPLTVKNSDERDYYEMAKNFCGKKVADRSWLVRLHFPRVKAASASQGQIFLAKKKNSGWFVWFKYH
jgi:hypothetical protein